MAPAFDFVHSEYSENPFEGLANDVPTRASARCIEIDIYRMLDETELMREAVPYGST